MELSWDSAELLSLFRDFHVLTSFGISLFGADCKEILRYPQEHPAFCALVRQNGAVSEKCAASDTLAFKKCKESRRRCTYRCHMNLIETATPIFYNSVIIGYIMIGQVRDKDSDFVGIAPSVSAIVPDIAAARRFYGELITVSEEQIRAASHILDVCAGYLYAKKLITLKNESIEKRIDEYIASNITGELTVNSLCRAFHTSRSELYHIFMSCFGKSVAAHIKYRRLEYAKELLKTTSLPVYKIAALCGIGDYNYFSKVFIKQYKISATAIRRS